MNDDITSNADILGGTPVFTGTRVPVESLFDSLKHGKNIDFFLEQFPSVKREQVEHLLDDAKGILTRPTIAIPIELYSENRITEFSSDEQALGSLLPDDV